MTVYFLTGKLGSGKTLCAVGKISDYLFKKRIVATNLDIKLHNMFNLSSKNLRLIRLPDKPTLQDFLSIGRGSNFYDESQNGLIVLDECGTWFNSRTWSDKTRQPVIDWCLHARKLGWDIIFIVQDISIVDKQLRDCLCEHLVICARTDRLPIPIIGFLLKLFSIGLKLPKYHLAIVYYGQNVTNLIVDRWFYSGKDFYNSYDTRQIYSDYYPHSTHSVLPPFYTHRKQVSIKNWRNTMRITKIYFKRFRHPFYLLIASFLGAFFYAKSLPPISSATASTNIPISTPTPIPTFSDNIKNSYIVGYLSNSTSKQFRYIFQTKSGEFLYSEQLIDQGYRVGDRGSCEALVTLNKTSIRIFCPPDGLRSDPPGGLQSSMNSSSM